MGIPAWVAPEVAKEPAELTRNMDKRLAATVVAV
jgi:hypothetical protein